jgi:hypothetical protein
MFCAWHRLEPNLTYVRFDKLSTLLIRAWELLGHPDITACAGVYRVEPRDKDGAPHLLLNQGLLPTISLGNEFGTAGNSVSFETRGKWDFDDIEYRLHLYRERTYIIETGCIVKVATEPKPSLLKSHEVLISLFQRVLSPKGKRAFGLMEGK